VWSGSSDAIDHGRLASCWNVCRPLLGRRYLWISASALALAHTRFRMMGWVL
jgi:hypothetical protein